MGSIAEISLKNITVVWLKKEILKIKVDLELCPEIVPGRETPFNE